MAIFSCTFCCFKSKFYTNLLHHYSREHENIPDFELSCQISGCLANYTKVGSLRKHVGRKHPEYLRNRRQGPVNNLNVATN